MGATFSKSKSASLSDKTFEEQKEVANQSDTRSNGTTTLGRKLKKKKEKLSKALSSDVRIDKFTSTDGSVVSSLACVKQLVDGRGKDILPSDALTVESISTYWSVTPSKDVEELRNACIRRGIISRETNNVILSIIDERVENTKITDALKETPVVVVTNNEQANPSETVEVSTAVEENNTQPVQDDEQKTVVETVDNSANENVVLNGNHLQDEQTVNVITSDVAAPAVSTDNQVQDEQVKSIDSVPVSGKKNKKKVQAEQENQSKS